MPRSLVLSLMLSSIAASLAHADPPEASKPAAPPPVRPLPETQRVRFHSGMTKKQRLVIRDQATWTKVWAELLGTQPQPPGAPAVDFGKDVVIVASMGGQSSGGYAIDVDDVRITAGDAQITVTSESPGRGCTVTAALTAPVSVVLAPRFAGQAAFVERTRATACK